MIHNHQHFDLLGKIILERVLFTPPLRLNEKLDDEACLLYSLVGNATLYGVSKKYNIQSDNGVLMKCGNYFNHWHFNKEETQNEAIAIHFYPDVIQYVYQGSVPAFLISDNQKEPIDFQVIDKSELIKPYIESLLYYFNHPEIVDEDIIILKVKELLNLLYKFDGNNIRKLLGDLFNPTTVNFKKTIEDNLYENLSLEEMAHLTNCSLATFKRRFKEIFDMSPAAFIREKRLERSAQMLQVSDDSILSICITSGFGSIDNFSKAFKKTYGLSPSEYRKKPMS
ncbi:MAG: helix-turn-helix transcriptional regulator [Cyclobacteriaceae bacterium]